MFETNLFSLIHSLVKERMVVATLLKVVVDEDEELAAISFDPPRHLDLVIAWKAKRAFSNFLLEQTGGGENPLP